MSSGSGAIRQTMAAFPYGRVTPGAGGKALMGDPFSIARPSQNWVTIQMYAEGRYAVDFDAKIRRSEGNPYVLPHVHQAITDAFVRASG